MSEKITLELGEATKEQLEEALERARDSERRCNEQGSWWHTWTTRREALERALTSPRFQPSSNEEKLREALEDIEAPELWDEDAGDETAEQIKERVRALARAALGEETPHV